MKSGSEQGVRLTSHYVSNPSPAAPHDYVRNRVCSATLKEGLIGDGCTPENFENALEVLGMEGIDFSDIGVCDTPAFFSIQ